MGAAVAAVLLPLLTQFGPTLVGLLAGLLGTFAPHTVADHPAATTAALGGLAALNHILPSPVAPDKKA